VGVLLRDRLACFPVKFREKLSRPLRPFLPFLARGWCQSVTYFLEFFFLFGINHGRCDYRSPKHNSNPLIGWLMPVPDFLFNLWAVLCLLTSQRKLRSAPPPDDSLFAKRFTISVCLLLPTFELYPIFPPREWTVLSPVRPGKHLLHFLSSDFFFVFFPCPPQRFARLGFLTPLLTSAETESSPFSPQTPPIHHHHSPLGTASGECPLSGHLKAIAFSSVSPKFLTPPLFPGRHTPHLSGKIRISVFTFLRTPPSWHLCMFFPPFKPVLIFQIPSPPLLLL